MFVPMPGERFPFGFNSLNEVGGVWSSRLCNSMRVKQEGRAVVLQILRFGKWGRRRPPPALPNFPEGLGGTMGVGLLGSMPLPQCFGAVNEN